MSAEAAKVFEAMRAYMDATAALERRRADNNPTTQIDNCSLYAGSPMYFYCRSCGDLADTLPEDYTSVPRRLCGECQRMKDNGWLGETS